MVEAYTYDKNRLLKNFGLTLIQSKAVNAEYRKSVEIWLDKQRWDDFKSEIRGNTLCQTGKCTLTINKMKGRIGYINPESLSKNPVFTQVVTTQGNGKTIYIGGQDAVNPKGEIVGEGDISEQTEQVMKNLEIALTASGATFEHLVKLTIYLVQGQNLYHGFEVSQKYLGHLENPPAISVLVVAGLANPDFLVEIDATAFVPEP